MAPGDTEGKRGCAGGPCTLRGPHKATGQQGCSQNPLPADKALGHLLWGWGCRGMQSEASQVAMGEILQLYLKRIKAPNPGRGCCFSLENLNLFFNVGLFILAFKA